MNIRMYLLAFALTALTAAAHAAKPSPEYVSQLGKVYSGIRSARDQRDICKTMYPQQHASYDQAWQGWQSKNHVLVTEFDQRYDRYLRDLANGKTAMYKQYKAIMENKFSESKMIQASALQHASPAQARQTCQSYAAGLEGSADPARVYAREIADSRRLVH
ncbi:MAG: hypothetical protein NVS3B11_28240 [Collimonas sp.]